MITSSSNPQIRHVQQLARKARLRRQEGLFVTEGPRMVFEAPPSMIRKVYLSEGFYSSLTDKAFLEGKDWELVADDIFRKMSETMTPQGVLCVMKQPVYELAALLEKKDPLLLLLEELQDPGNLGTLFRTAEGAGVDGILMTADCVDLFNPKTIRSTMGSIFRMPFVVLEKDGTGAAMEELKARGIQTCAAHLQGSCTYDREDYRGGTAFLIGNEGNGLSDALARAADKKVIIPMEGQLESLNAAVAGAILMYEAYRQRRN